MKILLVTTPIAIALFLTGCFLGFKVGSEKTWANASVYYVSANLYTLDKKGYKNEPEWTVEKHQENSKKRIHKAVEVYARHLNRWESKVPYNISGDKFTERSGETLLKWFTKNSDIDYKNIEGDEYFRQIEMIKPTFYSNVKKTDPELYTEFKSDAFTYLINIKNAINHHNL